jgi:hypothetical protein
MGQGATARRIQQEVSRLHRGAEALDKVSANRSPLDTVEAHTKKVATIARKFDAEVTSSINRISDISRDGRKAVERRIDDKVNLKPDAFAGEIRATFRAMSGKDRMELLARLVKENRGPELAAIVKAPPILTGISEAQRARFESAIIGQHAPAELAEQAEIDASLEESFAATRYAGDYATSLVSPAKVAVIEAGEAAADAAVEAFVQTLGQ